VSRYVAEPKRAPFFFLIQRPEEGQKPAAGTLNTRHSYLTRGVR